MSDIQKSAASTDSRHTADSNDSKAPLVQEIPKRTWKSHIWDTFDKSPEERRFLFKLDAALMTLASLGYFIKYLDQVMPLPYRIFH